FLHRLGQSLVAWTEGIEGHVAVAKEILPSALVQPDGVRKYLQRKGLRKILYCIKSGTLDEGIDQALCVSGEGVAKLIESPSRQDTGHHPTCAHVQGRIDLQQQTLWPPRLLLPEVTQAHTGRGAECPPILQSGMHVLVTRQTPHLISLQPHDWRAV